MSNIYPAIEFLLTRNNMTKKDLADKTGIPYSSLISSFNRHSDTFSLSYLKKITDALDTTVDDLMSFTVDTNDFPIGQQIKIAREKAKLTQLDIANLLGKSVRMIQKYENNEVTPSIKQLKQIVEKLGGEISISIRWD